MKLEQKTKNGVIEKRLLHPQTKDSNRPMSVCKTKRKKMKNEKIRSCICHDVSPLSLPSFFFYERPQLKWRRVHLTIEKLRNCVQQSSWSIFDSSTTTVAVVVVNLLPVRIDVSCVALL
jgi:hypothetical protein